MDVVIDEFTAGIWDLEQMVRVVIRLIMAGLLGGLVGLQRERAGKAAGLRTHMLVSVSTALVVISCIEFGMSPEDLSRVIQGLVTGIGFIGAGTILKLPDERYIGGLTTAASVWMTAAVGVATGLGRLSAAIVGVAIAWIILAGLLRFEKNPECPEQKH